MIRINLIATAPKKRMPVRLPAGAIVKTLIVLVVLAAVGISALYTIRFLRNRPPKALVAKTTEKRVAAEKPAKTATPLGKPSETPVTTEFEPSTHVQQKMVEEVVSDAPATADKGAASVLASLTYHEMSRGEQINYELTFTKNILQILTRAVPEGIGFSTFSIDSFQTVSAKGFAPTREQVTSLFGNLRQEKFELSNPPHSSIRSTGNKGYQFTFTCEVPLGSNPMDPWLLTDHLESRLQLGPFVKTFVRLASQNGVALAHGLTHIKTYKTGSWRRSVYHLSGKGSYRNFVRFVMQLHQNRIPCSFSAIYLRARSNGSVDISADVVLTTRE
jgi:hypothetical protein